MFDFFKNLGKKKLVSFAILAVVIISLPLILLQVQKQQNLRQRAEGLQATHFSLVANTQSFEIGKPFLVSVVLYNPTLKNISAVDILLTYNNDVLDLVSVEPSYLSEVVGDISLPGKIHYVGIAEGQADFSKVSNYAVTILTFKPKTKGLATINFSDTLVTAVGDPEPLAINPADNKSATYTIGDPTPAYVSPTTLELTPTPTPTSISPTPSFRVLTPTITPEPPKNEVTLDKTDLDVTYIELLPRYNRYEVEYLDALPKLKPGTKNSQKKPNLNQAVTFIAHIKNRGTIPSDEFKFKWIMDGVELKSGVHKNFLVEGQEEFLWNWQNGNHILKFVADLGDPNLEDSNIVNNSREISTDALSFRIHVERTVYDTFNNNKNLIGTYSFEDWVQAHADLLNEKLAYSNVKERVRIDKIDVENDNSLPRTAEHAPLALEWDSRWGFETTEWNTTFILSWVSRIQPALIHEWTHQLGLAHVADANIDIASDNSITGKRLIQTNPAIAGEQRCCDDIIYGVEKNLPFSDYSLQALNVNKGYRRGYYGDYLFDVPTANVLKFRDAIDTPLKNAQIKIWQSSDRKIFGNPIFAGVTNLDGELTLPNRSLPNGSITTATGHTLRPNPFGKIDVLSRNGLFLIETSVSDQKEYVILTIHNFNLAYWRGSKERAEHIIPTALVNDSDPTNIALGKSVSVSSNNNLAPAIVDGDVVSTSIYWEPFNREGKIGDWIKLDLGGINKLYKINIYSFAGNFHDWYGKFHLEVSTTGVFQGEEKRVATEVNWDQSRLGGNAVSYIFNPVDARYIRIVSGVDQNFVRLAELEIFRVR